MTHARLDAQWGSVPTRFTVIGSEDFNALERFGLLSAIAGQKLYSAMGKSAVDDDNELRNENDRYTFWLKALKKFSGNFKTDYVGEQMGFGSVFTGRLYDVAGASANLCLSFSASFPEDSRTGVVGNTARTKRTKIPKENKVRAELQKEIASVCPFCDSRDVGHFEIHHIDENPSNNDFRNLLLVCPTCHSKITKGDITLDEVRSKKASLYLTNGNIKQSQAPSAQIVTFNGTVRNAVVGNHNKVTITNLGKSQKSKYPEGCIGSDNDKANYIGYLITKYHEFQELQIGKEKMNYAIFPSKLKKEFKMGKSRTIYNVPIDRFEELAEYIKRRIDGTKVGRIRKARNQKSYSTFEEYIQERKH